MIPLEFCLQLWLFDFILNHDVFGTWFLSLYTVMSLEHGVFHDIFVKKCCS